MASIALGILPGCGTRIVPDRAIVIPSPPITRSDGTGSFGVDRGGPSHSAADDARGDDACRFGKLDAANASAGYSACISSPEYTFHWSVTSVEGEPGAFRFVHFDAGGRRLSTTLQALPPPPKLEEPVSPVAFREHAINVGFLYDFDDDGEPELLFLEGEGMHDLGFPGVVVGAGGGKVHVVYAPPEGYYIENADDIDGDDRPDLFLHTLFGGDRETGCDAPGNPIWSPAFVAHSVRGGAFSIDDSVARGAAKEWCGAPPKSPATTQQILCAVLWRERLDGLAKQSREALDACEKTREARVNAGQGCNPDQCDGERERLEQIRFRPLFFLP